jgi:hypothetical protein
MHICSCRYYSLEPLAHISSLQNILSQLHKRDTTLDHIKYLHQTRTQCRLQRLQSIRSSSAPLCFPVIIECLKEQAKHHKSTSKVRAAPPEESKVFGEPTTFARPKTEETVEEDNLRGYYIQHLFQKIRNNPSVSFPARPASRNATRALF